MPIILLKDTTCCGLKELNYIGRYEMPKQVIIRLYKDLVQSSRGAFILFTDAVVCKAGEKLAREIKKNNLGALIETKKKKNLNSGRLIKVYVWERDDNKLKKYFEDNADEEDKKLVAEYLKAIKDGRYDDAENVRL